MSNTEWVNEEFLRVMKLEPGDPIADAYLKHDNKYPISGGEFAFIRSVVDRSKQRQRDIGIYSPTVHHGRLT